MTWLLLAVGAASFYGLQGAWSKRITATVSRGAATWALFAFSFPVMLGWLLLRGMPEVGAGFWPALGVNLFLYPLSLYLYVSALDQGELSVTYPLLALTPILVIPVEWILLGETPGPRGAGGILLVVVGVYLLNFTRRAPLLEPFRRVAADPAARRMLLVVLIWAVGGTVDRVAVLASSPPLYGTIVTGTVALGLAVPLHLRGEGMGRALGRGSGGKLAVQGLLFAAMFVCQMEALRLALAAYVLTIKRTGTLVGVLLGWAAFEERWIGRRLVGTAVILAGAALVAGA